ncbi:hypothetical protein ACWXVJ_02240 [Mycoplasma sp. 773]
MIYCEQRGATPAVGWQNEGKRKSAQKLATASFLYIIWNCMSIYKGTIWKIRDMLNRNKNEKIKKVTPKNDATFLIGADRQYYFYIDNKTYKAFELNENDIQMYENITYSKKLPLEISAA